MTSTYTVEKIAAFVDGCSNSAIQKDLRDLVSRHLLDSIGCAIGAIGAKVTHDIKAVVDAFGGKPICTLIGGGLTSPDRAALYNGCLVPRPTLMPDSMLFRATYTVEKIAALVVG